MSPFRARGRTVLEGTDGPRLYEMAEMGRRSRRSSCVSFSISQRGSQRSNRRDDRQAGEGGSDEEEGEAIPDGRTDNEDHED